MYNIGIDRGGTNIQVGVVNDDFKIVGKSNIKTDLPRPAEEIADSIATVSYTHLLSEFCPCRNIRKIPQAEVRVGLHQYLK